jgi:alpha-D-xyloside xylohydrolase
MLVGEPPRDASWRMTPIAGGYRYTGQAGSVAIFEKPFHIEFRDAE